MVIAVLLLATLLLPEGKRADDEADGAAFDPFAGGYPVPPMPGQRLPELAAATVVSAEPDDERDDDTQRREDERG